jgi:integrase
MPKMATPLSAAAVRTAKTGRHFDGDGLVLLVRAPSQAFWLFRYSISGRVREAGLGRARGHNAVSLAEARERARRLRDKVREGKDPLAEREAEAAAAKAEAAKATAAAITFAQVSDMYIAAHEAGWRNPKHRQQWKNTLRDYVLPLIGALSVAAVDTGAVMKIIEPLWQAKPETASRVRGRIEALLDYAKARGWRDGENPARWRGHLDHLLPARSKVQRVQHHDALPWRQIGSFVKTLRETDTISARTLDFLILTATRSSETRGARWNEIDLANKVWMIPPDRMKAGRELRVPLVDAALDIVRRVEPLRTAPDALVFPGGRQGRPLSDVALAKVLRAAGGGDATVHGMRSAFRDWCAETTNYPRELAEAALAHVFKDKTEAAYQRGDLLEKRRRLMAEWATFCSRPAMKPEAARAPDGFGGSPSGLEHLISRRSLPACCTCGLFTLDHGGSLIAERRNRGYTLYNARSGAPVARLRPTDTEGRFYVLYWLL